MWEKIEDDAEYAYRLQVDHYIGIVRLIVPSESSQWRNRIWVVYWQYEECILAQGYCYGTKKAMDAISAIIGS